MQPWNNIIETAMLGTDKKQIGPEELPAELSEVMPAINNNPLTDKEEKFLQAASLVFNYRQSGVLPLHKEGIGLPMAPTEDFTTCSTAAIAVLNDIIQEDSIGLLTGWLQLCETRQQLVTPAIIPVLMARAEKHKSLQSLVEKCCGKRGAWLTQFNPNWLFSSNASTEELWQTGTPDQRKQVLQQLRITDPAAARQWLQQTWPQENAAGKTSFLKILSTNAGDEDIEWLELVADEKAQKVKEEALNILKMIPASAIVQKYWSILKDAVVLKKEKALLGLTTRYSIQIQLPVGIDETIFKTGIEKLSNQKGFTDDEFIILQLIKSVPPAFWEIHFDADPEAIIGYFQQQETSKKFLPALVTAIIQFKDQRWAFAFMQHSKIFYIDIIPLLPRQQQEYYSNKFFEQYADNIIQHATERNEEWGIELTKNIFNHAASNSYQYNRSFYNRYIRLIPVQITNELEKITPKDEYNQNVWANTSAYIVKLLTLKNQTAKAF